MFVLIIFTIRSKTEVEKQMSLQTYPHREKEDLLPTSHDTPVVKDRSQLAERVGVERSELTLEQIHI